MNEDRAGEQERRHEAAGGYEPSHPALRWLEQRLPLGKLIHAEFVAYPTPRNLNYWWAFGAILSLMLAVQIVTGIVLAMHYTPHVDHAFNSVESIMRDVSYGCCATSTPTARRCSFSRSTSTCSAASTTARTSSRASSSGSSA